jgi:hypothetical protein
MGLTVGRTIITDFLLWAGGVNTTAPRIQWLWTSSTLMPPTESVSM